ncbi:BofC C-terminal domain-containing protein [Paenibacillus harenae]|uniref:Forespore regulator of the sigma-K checkpoint n=1 Tax=Paenibacillus harenae TaxID=306543 RepID=A0ABT9TVU1_PAEHA|nr:BofC C-terminal domain-containing protein [Paenibacillus harenae]MDQ0110828.1 forespore regulator of the sigma-K checkpoint [Paenibacillus harenae]
MMEFSLWKQLRRRLRRKRRPLWMLGGLLPLLMIAISIPQQAYATYSVQDNRATVIQALRSQEGPVTVNIHRLYVCGEETMPLGRIDSKQLVQLLASHPEWEAAAFDQSNSSLLIEHHVDDLSDYCKNHAYIGIDKDGNLTLYDGEPKKEKVVRTFFQLDVRYMESSLPQDKLDQLTRGIRISDIDEYNSVLSTYSDFARSDNEKVMKPTY